MKDEQFQNKILLEPLDKQGIGAIKWPAELGMMSGLINKIIAESISFFFRIFAILPAAAGLFFLLLLPRLEKMMQGNH